MLEGIHSFTTNYGRICNRPETSCLVSAAWLPEDRGAAPSMVEFNALWDTGATASVITQDVVTKLNLPPEGTTTVFHAQGSEKVPYYFVNLGLPNGAEIAGVQVLRGILEGCDLLIGMDIINLGDFAITNKDGVTMLSFIMPSINHIDFAKVLEKAAATRNDQQDK